MGRNDICMLCGCERKWHDEGLGTCFNCNSLAGIQNGCNSFREKGSMNDIENYQKQMLEKDSDIVFNQFKKEEITHDR